MTKKMTSDEQNALLAKTALVFRPGTPVDSLALFSGRFQQLKRVVNAINQPGQHVILYGERGVGKTSLARVLSEMLTQQGQSFLHGAINCDRDDDFSSVWHKVFRKIVVDVEVPQIGFRGKPKPSVMSLASLLPEVVRPDDIRHVFAQISQPVIVIIDEVDTIKDERAASLLADTIKNLSDHAVTATLVIVGVADSVDELINEHKSVERALVQVPMPRMPQDELFQIMDRGAKTLGMSVDDMAKRKVARLSQGLPHYAHSLSLHASQTAIYDKRFRIEMADVDAAIRETVESAQSNLSAFDKATMCQQKNNIYRQVLLACALASKTDLGYFTASDVKEPLTTLLGKTYEVASFARHLYDFADEKRGPILKKSGEVRRPQYRFVNPMMQPFVILHSLAHGLITDDVIKQFSNKQLERQSFEDLW